MKNELREHKKSDKIKWVFTVIAFILIAVFLVGLCLQIFGTGKQKPSEWVKPAEAASVADSVVMTDGEARGMRLMSARSVEDTSTAYGVNSNEFDLSVEYVPSDATNKGVDYVASFKNPDSTWATGKDVANFVQIEKNTSVTVGEMDSAKLTVKKSFSEPIIVKAVLRDNPDIFSTVQVDYVCETLGIFFKTCDVYDNIPFTVEFYNGTLPFDIANNLWVVLKFNEGLVKNVRIDYYEYCVTAEDLARGNLSVSIDDIFSESGCHGAAASYLAGFNAGPDDAFMLCYFDYYFNRCYNGLTFSKHEEIEDFYANLSFEAGELEFTGLDTYITRATGINTNVSNIVAG